MKDFPTKRGVAARLGLIKTTPPHILLIAAVLSLFSCVDEPARETLYEIRSEAFATSGSKMAVSGNVAQWVSGDKIKINNTTATVTLSGGMAYLTGDVLKANVYRAVYPASIVASGTDLSEDEVTVTLPSTYTYGEQDGRQVLDLPMAAAAREFPLTFKHLTAGLLVEVRDSILTGITTKTLYIDKISVISSGYKLSGNFTFNIDAEEYASNLLCTSSSAHDTSVVLEFSQNQVGLNFNNTKTVFIPVPAVGSSNKFKIKVDAHYGSGSTMVRLSKAMTQSTGGSLGRNMLAYAPIVIKGNDTPNAEDSDLEVDEDGFVLIHSATEFKEYADYINRMSNSFQTKSFRFANDIDFGGDTILPVRNFAGTFDGNGYKIKNVYIRPYVNSPIWQCGIFTSPSGACTIQNLTLENVRLLNRRIITTDNHSNDKYFGFFVGETSKNVTISNCTIIGCSSPIANDPSGSHATPGYHSYVGLFIGYANSSCTIRNSNVDNCDALFNEYVADNKSRTVYYGGLVGYLGSGTLTATNNTLTGRFRIQFKNTYNSTNHKVSYGTILGYSNGSKNFSGNSVSGFTLTKPNNASYTELTTHQECGN